MTEIKHTSEGIDFRIILLEIIESEYGKFQCVDVVFRTQKGLYRVPLKIADELIPEESTWKDYVCQAAYENYKRNHQ